MSITCDKYIDMNTNHPNGTTLTVAIMNAGSIGSGGTWTMSPATPTGLTINKSNKTLFDTIDVRAVVKDGPNHSSRSIQVDNTKNFIYANLDISTFATTKVSVGGWSKLGPVNIFPSGNLYDLWQIILNLSGDLCEYQIANGSAPTSTGYGITLETTSVSHGTINSGYVDCIPGNIFWITIFADCAAGVYKFNSYNRDGSIFAQASMAGHQNGVGGDQDGDTIGSIRIGQNEAGADGGTSWYEDMVIDWTTASFPLIPSEWLGSAYITGPDGVIRRKAS